MTQQFPTPEPDETLERYTVRCAKLVKGMDPDDFNESVWATWNRFKGPTEEERVAHKKFSPDKYQTVPGVCVFAEHETTTAKGEHRKYDLRELVKIVRGNNDRISDVGHFPAISDGHTSDPDDPNQREPNICGYAGNYRLGLIGRKKPRWGIFQDEYQLKKAAATLEGKPRRSVELWTFKDGRAHFDPIAAIGAEAPRLPLPQRYSSFDYQGATVERYSCEAGGFSSPGAFSTHVPTMGNKKKSLNKTKYAAEPSMGAAEPLTQGEQTMPRLAPEDLREIVAAIAETPQFKYLTRMMEEQQGGLAPGSEDDDLNADPNIEDGEDDLAGLDDTLGEDEAGGEMGGEDIGGDMGGEEMPPEAEDVGDLEGGMPEDEENEAPEPEEDEEKFSMSASQGNGVLERYTQLQKSHNAVVEKYSSLQRSHDEALKDMSKLHGRLQSLERVNADHARRNKLLELKGKFGDFIDMSDEGVNCLYSQKANMTDEQFDKHVTSLEKYAARAQQASVYIPSGDAPKSESEMSPERYSQSMKIKDAALKIHAEQLKQGKHPSYDECKQIARERLQIS